MGIGGKTASLLPKKEKIIEKPKKAGATNKRIIPSSEFRKFYDRETFLYQYCILEVEQSSFGKISLQI